MSSHSSSVMSPWLVRQVCATAAESDSMDQRYAMTDPMQWLFNR